MKNLNKLIRELQSYYWLGLCCGILQAEIVITEFFINSAEGTQIPQYIELYNTSTSDIISLAGWSIKTYDEQNVHSGIPSEFIEGNFVKKVVQKPHNTKNSTQKVVRNWPTTQSSLPKVVQKVMKK